MKVIADLRKSNEAVIENQHESDDEEKPKVGIANIL